MATSTTTRTSPLATRMASIETLATAQIRALIPASAGIGWRFEWDNAVKRGGACFHSRRTISLSRHLAPRWSFEEVQETILHEIAHAIAGRGEGHGPVWRRIALSIGSNGKRCHQAATANERMAWQVVCPNHGVLGHRQRRPSGIRACVKCRAIVSIERNPDYGNPTAGFTAPTPEEAAAWDAAVAAAMAPAIRATIVRKLDAAQDRAA